MSKGTLSFSTEEQRQICALHDVKFYVSNLYCSE